VTRALVVFATTRLADNLTFVAAGVGGAAKVSVVPSSFRVPAKEHIIVTARKAYHEAAAQDRVP